MLKQGKKEINNNDVLFKNSKESFFKILLKKLFLRPPFIGWIIILLALFLALMNSTINVVSLSNLGTICSSIATEDEIKEYKDGIINKIVEDFSKEGITIGNLNLSDEELNKIAGVNMIKTSKTDTSEGKNIITGVPFTGNSLYNEYNYLDSSNNSVKINYSFAYVDVNRSSERSAAKVMDLFPDGENGGISSNATFEEVGVSGEDISMAVSNFAEPFLVKQSIPLYLYMSTYNNEISNGFIENPVFNSQIEFEEVELGVGATGKEGKEESVKVGTLTLTKTKEKIIKEENGEIKENLNVSWSVEFKQTNKVAIFYKNYDVLELNLELTSDQERSIKDSGQNCKNFSTGVKSSYGDNEETTNLEFEYKDVSYGGDEASISYEYYYYDAYYTGCIAYGTAFKGGITTYLLKNVSTWFGNFKFQNDVLNPDVPEQSFKGGQSLGCSINTKCKYSVNEEAKNALLELFKEKDSSLANLELFANYIEQNAIENDDYNLKLVYYGLCRMFEDVEEVNIEYNEEIEELFATSIQTANNNIEIATVPADVYNVLIYTTGTASGEFNQKTYSSTWQPYSEEQFNEYTMLYGPCYAKKIETQTLSYFMDLNVSSGFTLQQFYEMFTVVKTTLKKYDCATDEYCYELIEACYYVEQDIGINGVMLLALALIEQGMAPQPAAGGNPDNPFNYGANYGWPTIEKIYPEEMDNKYESNLQKCVYITASYLKINFFSDASSINEWLSKLNLELDDIKYQDGISDEEFYEKMSLISDDNIVKSLKAYRYYDGVIGASFSAEARFGRFGASLFSFDGYWNHGYQTENKYFVAAVYKNMKKLYRAGRVIDGYTLTSGLTLEEFEGMNYWLYIPEAYALDDITSIPVILYMHSIGPVSGYPDDPEAIFKDALPAGINDGAEYPAIIIMPHYGWGVYNATYINKIMRLVDYIVNKYDADENRVSITGYSYGANAAYLYAAKNPTVFSAVALVSGNWYTASSKGLVANEVSIIGYGERSYSNSGSKNTDAIVSSLGGEFIMLSKWSHGEADDEAYLEREAIEWLSEQVRKNVYDNESVTGEVEYDNPFYEIAEEKYYYLVDNGYTYGYIGNYEFVKYLGTENEYKKQLQCSDYVCWCLYLYGYEEFGYLWVSSRFVRDINYLQETYGWEKIESTKETLQPGDILVSNNHTEIYAGNGKSFTWSAAGMSYTLADTDFAHYEFAIRVKPPEINEEDTN